MNVWPSFADDDAREYPALAVHAHHVDERVPVVTASEFRRFLGAWRANDPNGTFSPDGVIEVPGVHVFGPSTFGTNTVCKRCRLLPLDADDWESDCLPTLTYDDGENTPDTWEVDSIDGDGNALYWLIGWDWRL